MTLREYVRILLLSPSSDELGGWIGGAASPGVVGALYVGFFSLVVGIAVFSAMGEKDSLWVMLLLPVAGTVGFCVYKIRSYRRFQKRAHPSYAGSYLQYCDAFRAMGWADLSHMVGTTFFMTGLLTLMQYPTPPDFDRATLLFYPAISGLVGFWGTRLVLYGAWRLGRILRRYVQE